ncbi:MAG TPA: glycosyltransferase family 39 protein [Bryobacterales bacterium]|nr:glycosyltransferase family 39 protein [Bryobacterales bacterium]
MDSDLSTSPRARAAAKLLYWILPILICLWVFRRGLFAWFLQDDFSWLRLQMHSLGDFWRLLTEPRAQGTIRPLSERFFFLAFRRLFGLRAFPYRLFVFLTQFASLALLTALARRITGSRGAALLACVLWAVNIGLLTPMTWTSAYNQILCAFFYLAGLLLFVRHIETGRWSYYYWQGGAFLLGFGALETIVAYPLVLLAYCLLLERKQAWKALPLLVPSAVYTGLHLWVIPRAAAGPYALHVDAAMLGTLWSYWSWALGAPRFAQAFGMAPSVGLVLALLLSGGLAAALVAARSERRGALFGLAWFALTIAPVLPLRDHRLDYYLTIPAIGLALAAASLARRTPRWAVGAWVLIYLVCSVGFIEKEIRPLYRRSRDAQRFIEAVRQARRLHPDKTILLAGVTDRLFYAVIYDEGLRTAGIGEVYLAPDNRAVSARPGLLPAERYELPARATLEALRKGEVAVYDASEPVLRNITFHYTMDAPNLLRPEAPRRVEVGEPLMASQLGPGWYGIQQDHRWMGRRAELRLAAPRRPGERLRIEAIYPERLNVGTLHLSVAVNGIAIGTAEIRDVRSTDHEFALPAAVVGLGEMTVTLEVDRTFRAAPDPRELGLAFGVVEVR